MLCSTLDIDYPAYENSSENCGSVVFRDADNALEVAIETEGLRYVGCYTAHKFLQYPYLGSVI